MVISVQCNKHVRNLAGTRGEMDIWRTSLKLRTRNSIENGHIDARKYQQKLMQISSDNICKILRLHAFIYKLLNNILVSL